MSRTQQSLGLPVALSIICLAAACSRQDSTDSAEIRPVKTMIVAGGDASEVRSFPGKVDASQRVELAFQVPGLLVRLPVKEGQSVAKGAIIAQLRQDEFQARLEQVQGQLGQAQAALSALRLGARSEEQLRLETQERAAAAKLANAKTEFERYARLVQTSAVSRSEYDLAATAYRVAEEDHKAAVQVLQQGITARQEDIDAQEATVRGLDGRVAEAKLQLKDSTLRAPYNGMIAQRFVEEGQLITPGKPVITFQNVDDIDIVADVPEATMAADIRSAAIEQIVAEFTTSPGPQFPLRVKEVAQIADPTTQTFQVRFTMKAPRRVTVLPGMTATVTATYRRSKAQGGSRILVPVSAVSKQETGEQVVWVLGPDQTVHRRPVKMGAPTGDKIEIVGGVQPGDRIVVAGASFLREGMKIRDLGDALGGG